ncbi:MAG: LysR family transcriptional regulator [Archangiaceae bacterium]|nr:LysR family transcriptional regulator [Archangiaceae bacterium]
MTTSTIDGLVAFQAVAQARSFTKAGQALGLDKSRVSRVVSALEAALGQALLVRSTRSVSLTAEGEALFAKVSPLLAGLQEALSAAPDQPTVPAGEVTITTTADLGRAMLAPALASFRQRFPAVFVRVVLANDVVDLMGKGVDLALRVGHPGAGSFIARKVGSLEAGFFASPAYLERRGTPATQAELGTHDGLWPEVPKGQRSFSPGGAPPKPAVQCADFSLLAELAKLGAGIALLPTFLAPRDGSLVRVLPQVSLSNAPLYLVSRPVKPVPPRVRALSDWLVQHLRSAP